MKLAGVSVVDLTQGEPDIPTDPLILEAMDAAARAGYTGYSPIEGDPDLRDAVAARIAARTQVATSRAHVIISAGAQAALFAAHHLALDEGDVGLYIDPHYATYPGTIRGVGGVPCAVQVRPSDGFQPQAEALAQAAKGAKSLLVNAPNNPTGVVYDAATWDGIAAVCQAQDLWLISDEVYDGQVWQGAHLSPRSLPGMAERTLVIGSMSKSHAMTGSRCGWVCAVPDVIRHLSALASNSTYGVAWFVQRAALAGLHAGTALENKVAAPFKRRRDITLRLLAEQTVLEAVTPQGGMYVMLDIRPTGLSGEAFGAALLDAEHIAVMPGESFGAAAAGHIRIAMTAADDVYADAVQRILRFAKERIDGNTTAR